MKILAIDTSSKVCSVAITEDTKEIIELHNNDEKTHSVKLMPMVDEAFKSTNLSLDNIDLLACCIGPGSFTGVRIGIATVKAFADAKNIPVVGVNSLEGLAFNLLLDDLESTLICPMIDAKNNNVYCGLFEKSENTIKPKADLMADEINSVIEKINDLISVANCYNRIIFVGDGSILFKELLEKEINCNNIQFAKDDKNFANSNSIAVYGWIKYLDGHYGDSNALSPLYLRKSQAERALEEKK